MNKLLNKIIILMSLLVSSALNADTAVIKEPVLVPDNLHLMVVYVNLGREYGALRDEWNKKYAHTDSSVVDYDEVEKLVSQVKTNFNKARGFLKHIEHNNFFKESNDYVIAIRITELYKKLVARGNRYLNNIEKDNLLRDTITRTMNQALLDYDEDILATVDRVRSMIEKGIDNNSK